MSIEGENVWGNQRLRLVITSACNINCFYCHNEGQPKGQEFLSESLFAKILEVIQAFPVGSITFTGGEALLHPRLEHFVQAVRPHCPSVTLVTNGILLTKARINGLLSAGLTKVRLGVDSLAAGKKTRPSHGSFPETDVMQTIANIKDSAVGLELNIVLTKFNISEIGDFFRFCAERKISAKVFEQVQVARFGTVEKPAEIHPKPLVEFPEFEENLRRTGVPFDVLEAAGFKGANLVVSGEGFSWRYCRYLCPYGLCWMTGTRIDPNGEVYTCMEKRFGQTLSTSETLATIVSKIQNVRRSGCCRSQR